MCYVTFFFSRFAKRHGHASEQVTTCAIPQAARHPRHAYTVARGIGKARSAGA